MKTKSTQRSNLFGVTLTRLASLIAAVGWLAGGSTGWAETITGTFHYRKHDPLSAQAAWLVPIQFCKVEVHSYRQRGLFWTWGLETTTTTDANGSISVTIPFQVPGVAYDLKVFAQNYAAVVLPDLAFPDNLLVSGPFWQEPGFPDGAPIWRYVNFATDILDFSYDFMDAYTPQHWNLADVVRHGFDYVAARRDPREIDVLPPAVVHPNTFWPNSPNDRARDEAYNASNQTIEFPWRNVWDDFAVLHLYAHFAEHQIGTFAAPPAYYRHDGCEADDVAISLDIVNINSAENAWMEGFADFFTGAVVANNPAGTFWGSYRYHAYAYYEFNPQFLGGSFPVGELENTPWLCTNLPPNITPNMIENVVAGVLWDVFDAEGACGTSEVHDALSGFDREVIQIMDRELDNLPSGPTIAGFTTAWLNRGLPAEPFLDILRHHGIVPPLPAPRLICPGDITVTTSAACGPAVVGFPTPTLDQGRRCAVVSCDPSPGSTFPIGTTTVNCSAVENGSVLATCSFHVTVQSASIPNPNGTGLLGIYYDNTDFTAPRVARTEAVNFDWGVSAPAPGVDADTFSVRWTGKVVPRYSDYYRIFTVSDDGVRLWIDGRLIVNEWNDHAATEHYGDIILEAGQAYDVVLEMYEKGGDAIAKLLWQSTCQLKEPIPATHLLPGRLECPTPDRPTFSANFVDGIPMGTALFGQQAAVEDGWLKLTRPDTAFGIFHINNFSGTQPVHGFEAKFTAALFGSTCCGGGMLPADGFSFNLVPAASVLANPGNNQPGEEGLDTGLAVNFDTWDNGGGEGPAVEVKWLGQVIARQRFQASQSPQGITTARDAAREVIINLASDGRLTVSYGVFRLFESVQTPYTPLVIGTPKWVIGARTGGANDNHWIRDLQIVVNRAKIPELFNTGVDNLGWPLTEDASDPHYVYSVLGGQPTGTFVAKAAGGFPIGPWLPDNTVSAWISPTMDTLAPENYHFLYETTFNLKGLNAAGAVIHGWVAADDQVNDIRINGQSTGQATALGGEPFTSWQAFAITSGIQPGANTLTFVTRNGAGGPNPTGLRVQMCGWATPPPLLQLNIAYARLSTTVRWGSLPHKQYFLEHTDKLSGPWVREPAEGIFPGAYQAQIDELTLHGARDPIRFYRVIEAP